MQQQPELDIDPVSWKRTPIALIVEPVRAMARLLRGMIEDMGFLVIEAQGPDEALAEIEHRAPEIDLVVSELSLGEVSGPKLAAFVAQRRPFIPIVLLCDQTVPNHVGLATRAVFLMKPFTREQLAGTIHSVAARSLPS
jgi:DNA-binding NtrC family response regulator